MSMTIRRAKLGAAPLLSAFVLLQAASPAAGFSGAFFHTQSAGNKGADVVAIQYLLRSRGYSGVTANARFDSATRNAVIAFQRRVGIGADGIVGPATWGRLIRTLRTGSSGEAVLALKYQLNAKRRAGLSMTATFDSATRSAVIAFQRHAGIAADGIVGATTWRNLVWHYMRPRFGFSMCKYNEPPEDWGTAATVGQLLNAAVAAKSATGKTVAVGDLSREHGGDTPEHASHEVGLDVDIRTMVKGASACNTRAYWWSSNYDRAATRTLVQKIRAAAPGHVKLIFFNDPVLRREGLTTYYAAHDEHLHVRFCEKTHPNALYDC
jgi:hypothetical protein